MRRGEKMVAVQQFGAGVAAEAIRRQPLSPGKVAFSWQLAAGPQLARAAEATYEAPATIRLRPRDPRWAAELERCRAVLAERLGALLGIGPLQIEISRA